MRGPAIFTFFTLLAHWSEAIRLVDRGLSPATVGLAIQRKYVENTIKRDAIRRRAPVLETLDNEVNRPLQQPNTGSALTTKQETLYFANVSLGTPEQNIRLHIDTGSSDLWVNTPTSEICRYRDGVLCSVGGTFDANSSSTYRYINSNFNITYEDDSGASGDYASDTIHIGGQELDGLQFGVGYKSTNAQGVLGIGYRSAEALTDQANSYSNLPQLMVDQSMIGSNAYSLWLDDIDSSTGSILFGGVDTDKYHGTLQTLPIEKINGQFQEFVITLSGLSLTSNGKTQSFGSGLPSAVLLDSGSSLTYLPDDITTDIYNALNVQYDRREGAGVVDCSLGDSSDTLDFVFTSVNISVPMSELVLPNQSSEEDNSAGNGTSFSNKKVSSICAFGIASADGTLPTLGDTWLRSAYVVYDLDNNEISLAQTNFNASTSHIVEIGTGQDSVPDASSVASPVQASVTKTGGARLSGPSTTSVSDSGATRIRPVLPVYGPTVMLLACAGIGFLSA